MNCVYVYVHVDVYVYSHRAVFRLVTSGTTPDVLQVCYRCVVCFKKCVVHGCVIDSRECFYLSLVFLT